MSCVLHLGLLFRHGISLVLFLWDSGSQVVFACYLILSNKLLQHNKLDSAAFLPRSFSRPSSLIVSLRVCQSHITGFAVNIVTTLLAFDVAYLASDSDHDCLPRTIRMLE